MSTEPTIEGLKELLEELKLTDLTEQLNEKSFERWKKRTEAQWRDELKEITGNASGFSDIYNYLNPTRQGTGVLILGIRVIPPPIQIDTNQMMDIESNELKKIDPWGDEIAVWVGKRDSRSGNEGIYLKETKIVRRAATVKSLLDQLEITRVLLIKSPPMTGKTSMATLIADSLFRSAPEKILIINLSMVDFAQRGPDWKFGDCFQGELGFSWADMFNYAKFRKIYLIIDEVQLIYKKVDDDGKVSSPCNKSGIVWTMAKALISNLKSRILCVFFAAYGSSPQNSGMATPVEFREDVSMFGIDCLNFTDDEMQEYVQKNLECLNQISDMEVTEFCLNLKHLCSSHVGLCQEVIFILNRWYRSKMKYGISVLAKDLLLVLWSKKVFERLLTTRAVSVVDVVSVKELDLLKDFINENVIEDKKCIQSLVKKGMLVEKNDTYKFSSPVMARYALQKIIGMPAKRAEIEPGSLEEFIIYVLSSLDYSHLKSSLGKTKSTGILLERAWQMEFYKTAIQCTPQSWHVSADVGGLFDSSGAIDFTVHSEGMKVFWGIELLRESDRINEHIARFGTDGRYNALCKRFTDHCLVDFRMLEDMSSDLQLDYSVSTLFYDRSFSNFLYYSKKYPNGKKLKPFQMK